MTAPPLVGSVSLASTKKNNIFQCLVCGREIIGGDVRWASGFVMHRAGGLLSVPVRVAHCRAVRMEKIPVHGSTSFFANPKCCSQPTQAFTDIDTLWPPSLATATGICIAVS